MNRYLDSLASQAVSHRFCGILFISLAEKFNDQSELNFRLMSKEGNQPLLISFYGTRVSDLRG